MAKFYAVRKGRVTGILHSWDECKDSVSGFSGAVYKSFTDIKEAENYLNQGEPEEDRLLDMSEIDKSKPYAFVDGSFNNKTNVYGCGGYLVIGEDKYVIQASDDDEEMAKMANISGEVLGARLSIEKAISLGVKELVIYYDCEGIKNWALGLWNRNLKGTKAYYEYVQSVKDEISLKFIYAKAHSGIEGNEDADKLAKEAVGIIK